MAFMSYKRKGPKMAQAAHVPITLSSISLTCFSVYLQTRPTLAGIHQSQSCPWALGTTWRAACAGVEVSWEDGGCAFGPPGGVHLCVATESLTATLNECRTVVLHRVYGARVEPAVKRHIMVLHRSTRPTTNIWNSRDSGQSS